MVPAKLAKQLYPKRYSLNILERASTSTAKCSQFMTF